MTTYQTADRAIQAYDAFIFAAVGRAFDADKADLLALYAAEDCRVAAQDRTMNQTTRNYYRERAAEFTAICA